jgi:hypothetical protein
MTAHASYRHVQPFTMLWLLLPAGAAVAALGAWATPQAGAALAFALVVPCAVLLLLGRLVIELRGDRLHWRFGFVGWPRWSVALDEIERIELTHARAIHGAGIKGLGRKRLFNVTMGGPALQLTLRDGRTILLGTPEPQRLRAFIEARQSPRALAGDLRCGSR